MLLGSAHHQEGPWWLIWRAAASSKEPDVGELFGWVCCRDLTSLPDFARCTPDWWGKHTSSWGKLLGSTHLSRVAACGLWAQCQCGRRKEACRMPWGTAYPQPAMLAGGRCQGLCLAPFLLAGMVELGKYQKGVPKYGHHGRRDVVRRWERSGKPHTRDRLQRWDCYGHHVQSS